jgi:hypothetical protein
MTGGNLTTTCGRVEHRPENPVYFSVRYLLRLRRKVRTKAWWIREGAL